FSALSVDWNIEAGHCRRLCLILMSLNSISIGNLADPNTRKYHLPFEPAFLADLSRLPSFSSGSPGLPKQAQLPAKEPPFLRLRRTLPDGSPELFATGGGSPYGMSLPQKITCPEWCPEEMLQSSLEENSNKSS
ncbi:Elongation factor 1-alpha, partial [Psidium guajava]